METTNNLRLKIVLLIAIVSLLGACGAYKTYTKPQSGHPAINDINAALQNAYVTDRNLARRQAIAHTRHDLNEGLLPDLLVDKPQPGKESKAEQRFDIAVNDMPARDFFMGLVKDTPYNIVVHPKVEGVVTLNLKQVTISDILQAAKDSYGFQFKRTPYGYEVYPSGLETRIFTVNYLDVDRKGKSNMLVSSGQISQKITGSSSASSNAFSSNTGQNVAKDLAPTSSVETTSKSDFWKQLLDSLNQIVGNKEGREVVINPAAGIIFAKAYPDELEMIGKYLDSMQTTMTRQVILEAKVIEVILDDEYQAGINWTLFGVQQTGLQKFSTNLPEFTTAGVFKINAHYHNANTFDMLIDLLATQGNVQVLSSPRIATLNNQKAIIKVGQDEFFITNVTNTTVTGTSTQNSQNVELTPFFSGIALDVTPEIDKDENVILHIHPMISQVEKKDLTYTLNAGSGNGANNTNTLPLALSTIRESDNIVSAENGQIVVIGGLMGTATREYTANTPFLSKAPVVGSLFRRTHQISQKTELIILLRPIVVGNNTWTQEMRKSAAQVRNLNRGFHYGTFPEIFGNKAEQDIRTR